MVGLLILSTVMTGIFAILQQVSDICGVLAETRHFIASFPENILNQNPFLLPLIYLWQSEVSGTLHKRVQKNVERHLPFVYYREVDTVESSMLSAFYIVGARIYISLC